jgi:NAD(P)-dependent dehydrogenase (short-subunit alcohol dehydrogenase family)
MLGSMKPVVLVTGATDGLGRGVALELARRGATVLVHGRDPARIERTVEEVKQAGAPAVRGYRADFQSLDEVRRLAREVVEHEARLDVLVNNAGIGTQVPGGGERQLSTDGHELRFAVNYLADFLLTQALLPLLKASAPARIVHVSSAGQAPLDFDDVMLARRYSGVQAYCQSKLAQIMFTFDLAAQLEGTGVTTTALHPATYMPTKIVPHPISSLEEGVAATVRLIVDPALARTTGVYFDGQNETRANAQAYDRSARARLAELSRTLTQQGQT